LNVFTPNKKSTINSDSSFSTGKLSINNRYKSNTFFLRNIYRNFNKDKFYNSSSYLKMNTISSLKNTKIIKKKFKLFPKEKNNKKGFFLSSIKINNEKKNIVPIPSRKEIQNLYKILMEKNAISIRISQEKELKKIIEDNNNKNENKIKNKNISLTYENLPKFEKEYNNINKNESKKRELNPLNKNLNFVNNKIYKDLRNTLYAKKMEQKGSILEINHVSNLPEIAKDKKLVFNLWKNDMIKYCKLTLDINNKNNKKFIDNLMNVYN
jgi:S-adenosylmethionine:tRNA-ribosyltransferase-isomerase (queuine synthetase)